MDTTNSIEKLKISLILNSVNYNITCNICQASILYMVISNGGNSLLFRSSQIRPYCIDETIYISSLSLLMSGIILSCEKHDEHDTICINKDFTFIDTEIDLLEFYERSFLYTQKKFLDHCSFIKTIIADNDNLLDNNQLDHDTILKKAEKNNTFILYDTKSIIKIVIDDLEKEKILSQEKLISEEKKNIDIDDFEFNMDDHVHLEKVSNENFLIENVFELIQEDIVVNDNIDDLLDVEMILDAPTGDLLNEEIITVLDVPTVDLSNEEIITVLDVPTGDLSNEEIITVLDVPTVDLLNEEIITVLDVPTGDLSNEEIITVLDKHDDDLSDDEIITVLDKHDYDLSNDDLSDDDYFSDKEIINVLDNHDDLIDDDLSEKEYIDKLNSDPVLYLEICRTIIKIKYEINTMLKNINKVNIDELYNDLDKKYFQNINEMKKQLLIHEINKMLIMMCENNILYCDGIIIYNYNYWTQKLNCNI